MVTASRGTVEEKEPCVGIWDLSRKPLSIGGVLLLAAEMLVRCKKYGTYSKGLCFVGKLKDFSGKEGMTKISSDIVKSNPVLDLVASLDGVGSLYHAPTMNVLEFPLQNNAPTWPILGDEEYRYGTYYYLQEHYRHDGIRPSITLKPALLKQACKFFENNVFPNLPVVVHLKNKPRAKGLSNANFPAWHIFFQWCSKRFPVTFILVGNEAIDAKILRLPNVIATKKMNCRLPMEMALLQSSMAFMGMATGPCNMAFLSGKPCVVFKNPEHDTEEMDQELGKHVRFVFCNSYQCLLRKYESVHLLNKEFKKLYDHAAESYREEMLL